MPNYVPNPVTQRNPIAGPGGPGAAVMGAGQALAQNAIEDKRVNDVMGLPQMREMVGGETADWITKGPGSHKRMGVAMQNWDKLTGGRISMLGEIGQLVQADVKKQTAQGLQPTQAYIMGSVNDAIQAVNAKAQEAGKPIMSIQQGLKIAEMAMKLTGNLTAAASGQKSSFNAIANAMKGLGIQQKKWEDMTPEERTQVAAAFEEAGVKSPDIVAKRIFSKPFQWREKFMRQYMPEMFGGEQPPTGGSGGTGLDRAKEIGKVLDFFSK